jgi:3-hydroxyisobutyrate dehydrogenase-like beta-hydroxyacid dehydrogenase
MNVGFVGLGSMGKGMASNIVKSGFPLWVYDLRLEASSDLVERGARQAENLSDLSANCNWIVLSLPHQSAVEAVLFGDAGLATGAREGQVIVDCGTTHPDFSSEAAARLREQGVSFLDAPVTGMETRAADGTLTIMVGGDAAAYEEVLPLLDAMGEVVVHMGSPGNGQLTKMTNNVLYNISCAAMAEMLTLAVKLGLDADKVRRVVGLGSGQSFGFDYFSELALKGEFRQGYPMASAFKDMVAVMEQANQQRAPLPVASGAMQTYRMALAKGLGEEAKGAMIKVWEDLLGVEVRSE